MGLILEEKVDKIIGNEKWELIGNKSSGMTTWSSEITTNMEFFKTAHRFKLRSANPCRYPTLLSSSDFHVYLPYLFCSTGQRAREEWKSPPTSFYFYIAD